MLISASIRHYLSFQHLLASALSAKQCQELETMAFLTPYEAVVVMPWALNSVSAPSIA